MPRIVDTYQQHTPFEEALTLLTDERTERVSHNLFRREDALYYINDVTLGQVRDHCLKGLRSLLK